MKEENRKQKQSLNTPFLAVLGDETALQSHLLTQTGRGVVRFTATSLPGVLSCFMGVKFQFV